MSRRFARAAEVRDDQERAQLHERVGGQVKQHGGDARFRLAAGERDQNVSGVRDRAVGQHALDVGLHERRQIADAHGEHGGDPQRPEPKVRGAAERDVEDAQHQREGGGLGPGGETAR